MCEFSFPCLALAHHRNDVLCMAGDGGTCPWLVLGKQQLYPESTWALLCPHGSPCSLLPQPPPAAAGWVIFSRDSSCISAAPARPWVCCLCLEPSPGAGVPRLPRPCQAGGGKGKETLLQAKHVFAGLSAIPGIMCSVPLALRSVQLPAALRAPLPFGYP